MIKYLDQDSESTLALDKMNKEFGSVGEAQIMVKNINIDDAFKLQGKIEGIEGVSAVVFDSSNKSYYNEGNALYKIFLKTGNFELESFDTIKEIRSTLSDYDLALNGAAVTTDYLVKEVDKDMTIILIVAVSIILVILTFTSKSFIEPIMFAIISGGAIVINMGTNIMLSEISFITKSICAIMQLALAMDYSIILLNAYNEEKVNNNNLDAMSIALAKSFAPVSSSSITTIAGLVALMFMSFSIGFDVGMVLAKGILISLLTVFLFMPGIVLIFDKLIEKTKHRSIFEIINHKRSLSTSNRTFASFQYKTRILIPIILLALVTVGCVLNTNSKFSYLIETSSDKNAAVNKENDAITDCFGEQNTLVVLIDKNKLDEEKQISDYLLNYTVDGKKIINSYQGLYQTGIYREFTSAEIASNFGINESLVLNVFDQMGIRSDGKVVLKDFMDYIVKNDYITVFTSSLQTGISDMYNDSRILFTEMDSATLAQKMRDRKSVV